MSFPDITIFLNDEYVLILFVLNAWAVWINCIPSLALLYKYTLLGKSSHKWITVEIQIFNNCGVSISGNVTFLINADVEITGEIVFKMWNILTKNLKLEDYFNIRHHILQSFLLCVCSQFVHMHWVLIGISYLIKWSYFFRLQQEQFWMLAIYSSTRVVSPWIHTRARSYLLHEVKVKVMVTNRRRKPLMRMHCRRKLVGFI